LLGCLFVDRKWVQYWREVTINPPISGLLIRKGSL
jgi:hypothetical protein